MQTHSAPAPASPAPALVSADGRSYPLESSRLAARAEGGMALSTLHQLFRNPHQEALEVVYTMPLPADGAVLGYVITIGERRIEGVIRSREDAARAYREALYEGRTAGLLEQERADTFTQTLGNIPPGTDVSVEIQVLHPLAFRPAEVEPGVDPMLDHAPPGVFQPSWEYRFPTVTGVRYMGGPGEVPDAGRLSPDRAAGGLPVRITLELEVADEVDTDLVFSPSHPLTCHRLGDGRALGSRGVTVSLAEGAPLDRDIVVQWSAATPEVGVRVVEGRGLPGDTGRYALVTILPPTVPAATTPRDVTLLLDTSGSMSGLPLDLGKRVIQLFLQSLEPTDRFELLTFGSRVTRLTDGMVQVGAADMVGVLERMHAEGASGHTDMQGAVEEALRPMRKESQRQVVLVTDGYIGFEKSVMASVLAGRSEGSRFHAVGVGAAPNRTLTGGLTRAGRGVELFAMDLGDAHTAAEHLVTATRRPILTDIRVTGAGVVHSAPARPRDVLEAQPLVLTVELSPEGGGLVVEGTLAGRPGVWRREVQLAHAGNRRWSWHDPASTTLPVGAIHGREVIADLELHEAADQAIEAAGLRHRIVSRRTSLVAVSLTPTVDPRDPTRRETLAVELPAGVSAEGVGLLEGRIPGTWGGTGTMGMSPMSIAPFLAEPAAADFEGDGPILYSAAPPAPSLRKRGTPPGARSLGMAEPPAPGGKRRQEGESLQGPGGEVEAELVLHTSQRLVVEFQVPSDGFMLPEGDVTVRLPDGRLLSALVVAGEGTQPGPHRAGVRVRLALKAPGRGSWDTLGFPPGVNGEEAVVVHLQWTGGA